MVTSPPDSWTQRHRLGDMTHRTYTGHPILQASYFNNLWKYEDGPFTFNIKTSEWYALASKAISNSRMTA